ncbi:hypothetical protein prwr041_07520 [Prevotella herbatica]|uniref:DUF2141 domain-containing protein n=1 Tax=Prevotella herbatica TaxID=2801997 RepID=A0ABM7NWM6_9BACT|nr:DUF2141 domain-containing protein [Prevotella herbatica]BCS84859.1 hypothetical protein prwr041_07520 [Prevotella herbatica]
MKRFILSVLVFVGVSCFTNAADLTISINGIRNNKGKVLIMIKSVGKDATFQKMKEITNDSCNFVFKDIENGTYKLSAFHDENGNYTIDKDEKGIPTEGFVLKTITVSNSDTSIHEDIKLKLFYPLTIKQ